MQNQQPEIQSACGDRLADASRYPRVLYKGREVLFCTIDCLKQYQKDPENFMRGDVIHTNSNKRTLVDQG
jgi:YHS domain-containing protein